MRILLVSSGSGSRGGGEIFLHYLSQGLSEAGHEVVLWIPAHPRMDELAEKCGGSSQVIRSNYRNTYDYKVRSLATVYNTALSVRVAHEWSSLRPDIIHINKQNLEDGLDLVRAANTCPAPTVCTIHLTQTADYLGAQGAWLRDRIAKAALCKYRGIFVAVQGARRKELDEFLGGKIKTETILNGVPLPKGCEVKTLRNTKRKELCLKDTDFLVLGIGRLVPQKCPFRFLEKARELALHIPTAKFLWVGDGTLRQEWEAWIKSAGLASRISCAGWRDDVLSYIAAGDLLLHVAEYEGLPLAIVEAMAGGLPCAVTEHFLSEVSIFDSSTVLRADDMTALKWLVEKPDELKTIAHAAQQLVEDKLSIHAMTEAYGRVYGAASQNATRLAG